jgi:hypothetical protein
MYKSRCIKYISKMKKINKKMNGGGKCGFGCGTVYNEETKTLTEQSPNDCNISCSELPSHCICNECFQENISAFTRKICDNVELANFIKENGVVPCILGCKEVNPNDRGILNGLTTEQINKIKNACFGDDADKKASAQITDTICIDMLENIANKYPICPYCGYGPQVVGENCVKVTCANQKCNKSFCGYCYKKNEIHPVDLDYNNFGGNIPETNVYARISHCGISLSQAEKQRYRIKTNPSFDPIFPFGMQSDYPNTNDGNKQYRKDVTQKYSIIAGRMGKKAMFKFIRENILNQKWSRENILKCLRDSHIYDPKIKEWPEEKKNNPDFRDNIIYYDLYNMIESNDRNLFSVGTENIWTLELYRYLVQKLYLIEKIDYDIIDNEAQKNEIKNILLPRRRRNLNLSRIVNNNTLTLTNTNTLGEELIQGDIPEVEFLIFGEDFQNGGQQLTQGILPNSIERLDLGNFMNGGFPITKEVLPQNLKAISLSSSNETVINLPENIQIVYMAKYSGILQESSLPQRLKLLYLNNYTNNNQELDSSLIPESVKYIINEGKTILNKQELDTRGVKIIE